MTVFWIVAALFLVGALLFVVPALLKPRATEATAAGTNLAVHRDQWAEAEQDLAAGLIGADGLAQARAEIRHRVLEDTQATEAAAPAQPARRTAIVLAVLIPLASVLTYLRLGEPQAVAPQIVASPAGRSEVTPEQIQQRVAALTERLQAEPGNVEGWVMLARSYVSLVRYRDAAMAMRRAVDLSPPNAGLLADLADLTGAVQGKRLAGEPARLIQQALDIDPRHVKSLALAGSAAFEARDYASARGYWQRLLAVVPAQSDMARSAQVNIAQASRLEGGAPAVAGGDVAVAAPPMPATPAQPTASAAGATLTGQVQLSPALAARLAPGDTLFIFARAAQGPRMPLAIVRRPADGKPFDFKLDDSMAMAPSLRLSGFAQVVVGARISRSGNATPQSGDLIGQSQPVSPNATDVRVLIDAVQP